MPFNHHIFCCTNRRADTETRPSCAKHGSEELRDYMKARVKELRIPSTRVNAAGCLDMCERGPAMVIYPEGIWYSYHTKEDVDAIIEEHILGGKIVERLKMFKQ